MCLLYQVAFFYFQSHLQCHRCGYFLCVSCRVVLSVRQRLLATPRDSNTCAALSRYVTACCVIQDLFRANCFTTRRAIYLAKEFPTKESQLGLFTPHIFFTIRRCVYCWSTAKYSTTRQCLGLFSYKLSTFHFSRKSARKSELNSIRNLIQFNAIAQRRVATAPSQMVLFFLTSSVCFHVSFWCVKIISVDWIIARDQKPVE